ncbi:hypothetical protein M422DRAFT_226620 [Sphaerobolus stellatus SS14]|uniref:AMP-dependent synthetase/ligase domain-containing protein n=1 Tax=Sphaerobolus stellatus (strain SS14) TaxID=990650 RepID=A0A0C9VHE7_SPHS4|nr:hypothetical protein M422DRAFT_226620 [Sphaerobolus stellatus SS14]
MHFSPQALARGVDRISAPRFVRDFILAVTSPSPEVALVPRWLRSPNEKGPNTAIPANEPLSICVGPQAETSFQTIHHAFSYYATLHPEHLAVEHRGTNITYLDLHLKSDILALALLHEGVGRGDRVCLVVQRGIAMVIGILGILKTGASYIPLDGGIVTDRTLDSIVQDACPKLLLASEKYSDKATSRGRTLVIETELGNHEGPPLEEDMERLKSVSSVGSDELYVIYTSGTTGTPKGVSITHNNVLNLVCTSPGNLHIRPGTRVSQLLNIAFDMCAWEVLACLSNGGTLVIRGSGVACAMWEDILRSVAVVVATPSILAKFDPDEYPNIQTVATAGEPCPQELADRWVTIVNTCHWHVAGKPISIGFPTPNNSVYILDETQNPLPLGSIGTVWAGGAGISKGYVNLPTLTASKFKPDPFSGNTWNTMYNTGDIGYMRPDRSVVLLGRQDDQVKIKGFRVELDGVAAAIRTCRGVTYSAALYLDHELWGIYQKTDDPESVSDDDVARVVKAIQPYYAVPSRYLCVGDMPLNQNGKIDKAALRRRIGELRVAA